MRAIVTPRWRAAALVAALFVGGVSALAAEDEEEKPKLWSDSAELSFVSTSGNSEGDSLGLKNTFSRKKERSLFEVKANAVRVQTTDITRFAVATDPPGTVRKTEEDDTSAENYFIDTRYHQKIKEKTYWYTSFSWYRNRPSGIANRYIVSGGLGNIWRDDDHMTFRSDYGITYTDQEDVLENPDSLGDFAGIRLGWNYLHNMGDNTTYENILIFDENLDDTDDYRVDMTNSVNVSMNSRLALKVSYQILFENVPGFEGVDLWDIDPSLPGAVVIGEVPVQLDDLDTILTASLVVNF